MPEKRLWEKCVKEGVIVKMPPDLEQSGEVMHLATLRIEFWSQKIDDRFAVLKVEAYYEIIKEMIFALLYKNGYNCANHQCLTAYLTKNLNYFDYEINKIEELRQIRNEIAYRGLQVNYEYLHKNELEFKAIISRLKEEIEREQLLSS